MAGTETIPAGESRTIRVYDSHGAPLTETTVVAYGGTVRRNGPVFQRRTTGGTVTVDSDGSGTVVVDTGASPCLMLNWNCQLTTPC